MNVDQLPHALLLNARVFACWTPALPYGRASIDQRVQCPWVHLKPSTQWMLSYECVANRVVAQLAWTGALRKVCVMLTDAERYASGHVRDFG